MRLSLAEQERTRRFAPGTIFGSALCLLATAALILLASQRRDFQLAAVEYDLPPDRVLSGTLPPTSARENLAQFSVTGDARFLRYAQAILNTATSQQSKPGANPALQLLRARILQAEHHFDAAAEMLNSVVQSQPARSEAWLMLADSLIRAGRADDARMACLKLALAASVELAQWCAILVLQANGDDELAYRCAQGLLASIGSQQDSIRRWMLEIAAESAARIGYPQEAIALYTRVVAIGGESFASRLALADVLIADGQNAAAVTLLDGDRDKVAALIRVAIGLKANGTGVDRDMLDRIETSFAGMSPENYGDLRLRDRALFELRLRKDFALALQFAEANWQQQKGPEDLALLREAAAYAPGAIPASRRT